jgi:hypothetical protein
MKTCATCNASHKNTVERVLRCMGCIAKQNGNTNWRPTGHNARLSGPQRPAQEVEDGTK